LHPSRHAAGIAISSGCMAVLLVGKWTEVRTSPGEKSTFEQIGYNKGLAKFLMYRLKSTPVERAGRH
jgi:hypothetical protein